MSMTKALLDRSKPTAADIKLLDPSEQKEMLELRHRTAKGSYLPTRHEKPLLQ